MSWRKILIKKIWSPFLNLINSRGRLPKLKFAFYTVIKRWQQKICTPNAAWMMISTQDTKSTTIMVPNFAFKLNLHVQVDLRYNLCIHVIDSLWLTNIFLFFSTPRQILSRLLAEPNKFFQRYVRYYNFEWDATYSENNFGTWQVLSS